MRLISTCVCKGKLKVYVCIHVVCACKCAYIAKDPANFMLQPLHILMECGMPMTIASDVAITLSWESCNISVNVQAYICMVKNGIKR